jgi:hypothetical protein
MSSDSVPLSKSAAIHVERLTSSPKAVLGLHCWLTSTRSSGLGRWASFASLTCWLLSSHALARSKHVSSACLKSLVRYSCINRGRLALFHIGALFHSSSLVHDIPNMCDVAKQQPIDPSLSHAWLRGAVGWLIDSYTTPCIYVIGESIFKWQH